MRRRLLENSICFRRLYKRLLKWQCDEDNTLLNSVVSEFDPARSSA